ncbi:hypothetical protein [uncultured Campylobacter sp.]|uniref:hypothetical protein n=1 Tax=uncultured Campylobacter sp. TaxID=218934 RepID=UPI0026345CDB|nr:hypothetical protein [uncultured Campylobacter sp.]
MKVICLAPNPHVNGAGLNFKSKLHPAALAYFTKRENFKNFVAHEQAVRAKATNRAAAVRSLGFKARAKAANREAISARRVGSACSGAKTARTMPIDTAASKNISNFAALKHCADRKNFKIFASDKIKFATHGEPKFTMHSIVKFVACSLKFEPCGTATRDFALCDKILSSRPLKSCTSFKISLQRGEKAK